MTDRCVASMQGGYGADGSDHRGSKKVGAHGVAVRISAFPSPLRRPRVAAARSAKAEARISSIMVKSALTRVQRSRILSLMPSCSRTTTHPSNDAEVPHVRFADGTLPSLWADDSAGPEHAGVRTQEWMRHRHGMPSAEVFCRHRLQRWPAQGESA